MVVGSFQSPDHGSSPKCKKDLYFRTPPNSAIIYMSLFIGFIFLILCAENMIMICAASALDGWEMMSITLDLISLCSIGIHGISRVFMIMYVIYNY